MLNYIILVNKRKDLVVIDYETDVKDCCPEVGYIEECEEWKTDKEEYMKDDCICFDKDKVFKETGIYKIEGYDNSLDTPDGYWEVYMIENITKIAELPY